MIQLQGLVSLERRRTASRAATAALAVCVACLWWSPLRNVWLLATERQWVERSEALITLDMLLHTVSLALVAMALMVRTIGRLHVLGAVAVAGASIVAGDIFVLHLHPFLMSHGLYPGWMGRGAAAGQSAQYAKFLLGAVLLVALGGMILFRRWRTFDRIYVWTIGASVLLTTVLFHFTIREAIFESRLHQARVMAVAAESPQPWIFRALCKRDALECFEARLGEPYPVTGDPMVDRQIPHHIETTKGHPGYTWSVSGSFPIPGAKPNDHHLMFHWADASTYRVVVERAQWHRTMQKFQLIYSWIGLPAHILWLAGGLWLMYWHKARWRRKAAAAQVA